MVLDGCREPQRGAGHALPSHDHIPACICLRDMVRASARFASMSYSGEQLPADGASYRHPHFGAVEASIHRQISYYVRMHTTACFKSPCSGIGDVHHLISGKSAARKRFRQGSPTPSALTWMRTTFGLKEADIPWGMPISVGLKQAMSAIPPFHELHPFRSHRNLYEELQSSDRGRRYQHLCTS